MSAESNEKLSKLQEDVERVKLSLSRLLEIAIKENDADQIRHINHLLKRL